MTINDELLNLFNELGIVIGENDEFVDLDSITFITMIIRIEETFGIIFPDDLLNLSLINNVKKLETIINNVLANEN